mmetsp:Transcript_10069/g.14203  ORF Transcript_10069/g.14203 Transcript_10069/m.14203 type:complete len:381 (-) Transcript_10069:47-1189(-)
MDLEHGTNPNKRSFLMSFFKPSHRTLIALVATFLISFGILSFNGAAEDARIGRKLQATTGEFGRILQTAPVGRNPMKIGIANLITASKFEKMTNAKYDIAVKFQDIKTLDYDYHVKSLFEDGKEVVIVMEFFSDNPTNLVDIINGLYDPYMLAFANQQKADGNKMISFRPLHEFNGDWYPWGTYLEGTNTKANFILAFRHIYMVFKRARSNFKMQLNYNCENPGDDNTSFMEWWPGEEYVDVVLCSAYNRSGISEWHTEWESLEDIFAPGYDRMLELPGNKPLGVGETSTVEGPLKAQWLKEAIETLYYEYPRVEEIDFFFINKEGDEEGQWDLNTVHEQQVFGNAINKIRGDTLAPTMGPTSAPTMTPTQMVTVNAFGI